MERTRLPKRSKLKNRDLIPISLFFFIWGIDMNFKKSLLIMLSVLCIFLMIASVSASDSSTDIVNATNDNADIVNLTNDENDGEILCDNEGSEVGNFADLKSDIDIINADAYSTIYLNRSYNFTDTVESNGLTISKSITIDGQGHIIDANGKNRVFYITTRGVNVVIKNITFINGRAAQGGAISTTTSTSSTYRIASVEIINCTFKDNEATSSSSGHGGAVYLVAPSNHVSIINSTFINNKAYDASSKYGGALYINCNYATAGCNIINSTFISNYANNQAGTIYLKGKASVNQIIDGCTFINNTGSNSASSISSSVFNGDNSGNFIVNNSIFINNSKYAVQIGPSTYSLDNNWWGNTENNFKTNMFDIYLKSAKSWLFLTFETNDTTGIATISLNNLYSSETGEISGYSGNIPPIKFNIKTSNVDVDKNVVQLNNDGKATFNYQLIGSSGTITVSYENINITKVIKDLSFTSLKNMIYSSDEPIIYLDDDFTFDENKDTGLIGGIDFAKSVTIDGQGHTLDAKNQNRIFNFNDETKYLVLKNIKFANANAGALYVIAKSLTLINCTFIDNEVASSGGAVYVQDSEGSEIINCTFISNSATDYGSAILINSKSTEKIQGCFFSDNSGGSVIYCMDEGTYNIHNSIFINNRGLVVDGESVATVNANYNWWGNTADNYDATVVNVGDSITRNNWLFLNMAANNKEGLAEISLNNLYTVGVGNSTYSNYALPEITLNISTSNAKVNKNKTIIDKTGKSSVSYVVKTTGSITASYNDDIGITKEVTYDDYGNFKSLYNLITNIAEDGETVELKWDYTYDSSTDSQLINQMLIGKTLVIDGKGHTIDAKGQTQIFKINDVKVTLKNIKFINGHSSNGGAVYYYAYYNDCDSEIINCTFINNVASNLGGAIYNYFNLKNIVNCTFINNSAPSDKCSAIYTQGYAIDVSNSILVGNAAGNIIGGSGSVTANNNWWGHTADNYETPLSIGSTVTANNWYVLNMSVDSSTIAKLTLNNLYDGNGIIIDNNYALPTITFNTKSSNTQLTKNNITLNDDGKDNIEHSFSKKYSITASYNGIELTRSFVYWASFTELKTQVDGATGELVLDQNYAFNPNADTPNDIIFSKTLTIDGAGFTIDAKGLSNIFNFNDDTNTNSLTLKNIIFANATGENGAAVYFNGNMIEIINCTFINNTPTGQGAVIYVNGTNNNVENRITQSTFINNICTGSVIYLNSLFGDASFVVSDSVFVKNTGFNIVKGNGSVNANYNWWGNNATNYNINIANVGEGIDVEKWFYLNMTVDDETKKAEISLNNLNDESDYSYALPELILNISAVNAILNKNNVVLGTTGKSTVDYSMTGLTGLLIASYNEVEFTKEIKFLDKGDFDSLQNLLNLIPEGYMYTLTKNYTYSDSDTITDGIIIDKMICVNGNGFTIDAKGKSRIFSLDADGILLKNIIFRNGLSGYGAAVYTSSEYVSIDNCTFINNTASSSGGAIYSYAYNNMGSIINSRFINNSATGAGVIYNYGYNGVIDNCIFVNNSGKYIVDHQYSHDYLSNSIFLSNDASLSIINGDSKNNWYGNTFDNYDTNIALGSVSDWLYLNIKFNETHAIVSLNNLYTESSGSSSVYSNYNLPEITLNVNSTTLNLETDTITIDGNGKAIVPYTMIEETGALTVSYGDMSLTKDRVLGEFDSLQSLIDKADENSVIELTKNYTYNVEYEITKGIIINKNITIDGKGHTIDAKGMSRIFNLQASGIIFKNIVFANGKTTYGPAIFYNYDNANEIDFEIVNCTFVNNTATATSSTYGGGAIFIKTNEGSFDIKDSSFINNSAYLSSSDSSFGGAIYLNTKNAEVNIYNNSFIKNKGKNGGAIYVASDNSHIIIDKCLFKENQATGYTGSTYGNVILWKTTNDNENNVVKNSIFIDNYNSNNYAFAFISGKVIIDDNWWGTDANKYNELYQYYIGGITPTSWLYINGTLSSSPVYVNEPVTVKLILKSYNSSSSSECDYDNNKLPKVNLTLSSEYGTIDKTSASLNEEIIYTATQVGKPATGGGPSVVVENINNNNLFRFKFENREHSILNLLVDNPFTMYCGQKIYFNDIANISSVIKPYIKSISSNESIVGVGNTYLEARGNVGSALITFYYDGTCAECYDVTSVDLAVNVIKIPMEIVVTNIESDEISIFSTDSINLNISLLVDDIYEGYAKNQWASLTYTYKQDDPNTNVAYTKLSDFTVNGASVNGTIACSASQIGTSNLTLSIKSYYYDGEDITIKFTVLKKPTAIELNHADSLEFKVDDSSKINATLINGTNNAQLKYMSNNTNVVSVDENTGEFTAVGSGTAIIQVKYGGNAQRNESTKEVTVTVNKYSTTTTLVSHDSIELEINENSQVTATLTSEDSADLGSPTYISSNESVATVDSNGLITAINEGSAIITAKYDGNYKYANSSDSVSVTVTKIKSSITLNTINPLQINVSDEVQIDAILNHEGSLLYVSSNPNIIEVNQTTGKITAKAGGRANITISYSGNNRYGEAEDVNLTVVVSKLPSHITAVNALSVDVDANNNIIATVDNGRSLRYVSNNPGIVTVNEITGVITGIIGGTANVTVIFDEDDQYLSDEVNVTVTVYKLQSTFTIENPTVTVDVYSNAIIVASSNNDGKITYASCDVLIATVDGNNVTGLKSGKVNVTLSVAETDRYLANAINVTVTVNKLQSTIVVADAITVNVDEIKSLGATVDENRQLHYLSTNPNIVTVNSQGEITGIIGGIANVTVIFDEDDQYLGSEVNVTVTVNKLQSTFTIDDPSISVDVYGNVLIDISSNNDGILSFVSCDDSIATVNGNNVTALKGGKVNVTVSVAETEKYLANETNVTITVNKIQSTIDVASSISVDVGGTNTIVASVDENRQLCFVSTNENIVSVGELTGIVTGVIGGTANVTVIFDEDDQYLGSEVNVSVTVNKLQSTITIDNPVIEMDVYGNALIIASSNNDGEITYASADALIAAVSGNMVTALKGGKVNVTVSVAETDKYLANEANVTITINKLQSTIAAVTSMSVDVDGTNTIVASVDENRQLRFVSTNENIVSVGELTGIVTGVIGGTANVTVIFDEDDQYLGSEVNVSVTVNKLQSTFTIDDPSISVDVYGNVLIDISSNNDGILSFVSCDDSIATVNGNNVTALKGGKVNVTVSVAETEKYLANETNVTITVNKIRPAIVVDSSISVDVDETKSMGATVNENRQLHYSSTNSSIVTVNANGEITGIIGGTAIVAVIFEEDGQYLAGRVNVTVTVKKLPSIFTNGPMSLSVDENATINSVLNHDGAVRYEFDSTKLNVTGDGLVIALAGGVHTISVIFDGNERYLENSSTVTVTVSRLPADYENEAINLTVFDTSNIEYLIYGYDHTNSVYSSSNETVFTVDANGIITAHAGGSALLNIKFPETDRYLGDSINITVNVKKLPTVLTAENQISVKVGETEDLDIGVNHNRQLIYESSNPNIVTVDDNGLIKGIIGGTAFITVRYEEDGQYLANSTRVDVTVNKLPSNINVETQPFEMYIDDEVKIIATTDNDGGLFFTTDSSFISLSGDGKVTGVSEGTANVIIAVFETDTHLSNRTTLKVTVKKIPTAISVEGMQLTVDVDDSILINASLNHPEAGALNFTSSNPEVVSVDGDGRICALIGGEANITISYAGDDKYVAAENVVVNVVSNRIPSVIQVNETISVDVYGNNAIIVLNGEGRQVNYLSTNPEIVTVNESTGVITGVMGGTANVTVIFDENEKYLSGEINVTVTVNKLPSIFTNDPMSLSVDENATINSVLNHDGAVRYEFDSTKLNVTGDGLVIALAGGVHTISVIFDGNEIYLENTSTVTVTVNRLPAKYDGSPINMSVFDTANIENIVIGYDHTNSVYSSGNESVFTVDADGTITAHAGGSAQLNIQIPETDRYNADSINITVNVEKLPSIFTGDGNISVKVNETEDLAVTVNHNRQLIYESSNPNIVTVDGNGLIKGIIGGTAFITVRFEGDGQYLANSTRVDVTVNKLPSSINVETQPFEMYIGDEAKIIATTDNDGGLFFTTDSSFISLSIDGNVTGVSEGTADIVIDVFETETHLSNRTTLKVTVKKIPTAISVEGLQLTIDVDGSILINASLSHPEAGALNFTSSNPEVVSVGGDGRITALIGGEANITVSYAGNDRYAPAENVTVNVVSNRLPTVIEVNGTFSLNVDDSVLIGAFPSHDGMQLKYLIGNSSVITIDEATGEITAIAEGVTDVTISCEGTDKYLNAENVTVSVEVTRIQTAINVSSANPVEINVFDESSIIASLNYPQAGTLTYTSSDENVVTVDEDGMITAIGGGKANITVSYAGNYKYAPAKDVIISVVVNKLVSLIIVQDAISVYVDNSKSLNAYMEIDRPLRYVSNNESVAFVDEYGFVTGLVGGKTNITIIFDGDTQYERCEANVTVIVNKLASRIDVENQQLVIEVGKNAEIVATTNSDAHLTYVSLNSTIASVKGIVVTGVIGGTVNVTVSVPESDRYLASEANVTVVVEKLQSVINIESYSLVVDVDGSVNIIASTNSDGNLAYESLDSSIATVDANVATGVIGGTAMVRVSVGETERYLANAADVIVVVNKLQSVINIESYSLVVDVDGSVNIIASTNSDGNLSYASLDSSIATVEGNVVTGVIGGTAMVRVSVGETERYLANAADVTVVVNKLQSVITIESDDLVVDVDGSVLINASSNSDAGLTYASLDSSIASVEGNAVTGISSGIVNVTVSVGETERYLAKDVNVTVTVNKAKSVISANDITIYVDETKSIDATLNVAGSLRYISSNPEIVSIDESGIVKGIIGGTANITIIFDETNKYLGSEINVSVTVNKLQPVINLESDSLAVEVEGNVLINASTDSDATLIYESLDESVATVNLNNVTALIGGKVIVSVSVPESDRYLAKSVNVTVVVKKHDSIIIIENDEISVEVDGKQQIVASTNSDSPIIFIVTSPIISIGGTGMVTGVSNGTAEVILDVAESDKYSANTSVVVVKVNKVPTAIMVNESISVTVDDETNINATLNHDGQLSFTSLDESIASIDAKGNIKAVKVGKTQIIVSFEENDKYLGNSLTVDVTVNKIDIPINDTISMDLKAASRTPTFSIDLPNAKGNFSVIVDGKKIGPVGLKDGKANITVPELAYGSHNVTVVYSGDDKYSLITQNTTVNITKPVLSKNTDISMLYTANAKYTVRVTVGGKAIVGQYVTFKFNGKTYNVKTDKNGYATFKLPTAKPKKAKYTITATFHNVTVKNKVKVNSIIKAKNLKIKKSRKVVKIKVSLKKVNGKYLKGKQLKLKIKGKTLKAKTNKKGVATFKLKKKVLKKLKAGKKYKYKVIYGKDVVTKKLKVKR